GWVVGAFRPGARRRSRPRGLRDATGRTRRAPSTPCAVHKDRDSRRVYSIGLLTSHVEACLPGCCDLLRRLGGRPRPRHRPHQPELGLFLKHPGPVGHETPLVVAAALALEPPDLGGQLLDPARLLRPAVVLAPD